MVGAHESLRLGVGQEKLIYPFYKGLFWREGWNCLKGRGLIVPGISCSVSFYLFIYLWNKRLEIRGKLTRCLLGGKNLQESYNCSYL